MLVWVASYQRSGNTLTMRTLNEVFGVNRFCTVHRGGPWMMGKARSRSYEVPEELRGLEIKELFDALRERPEPFFVKSHRLQDSYDRAPALYVVRDGRDVLVSRAHWLGDKKAEGFEGLSFEERLEKLVDSGKWSNHVRTWRTRLAPTVLVRFEELVADPGATVKRACDEIGVPLPEPCGELTPFEKLQESNPAMHRRGSSGAWREEMPAAIEQRFWRVDGREMEALAVHGLPAGPSTTDAGEPALR